MGPSEVLAPLGAGGMGVYRAKDTKLGREVALEILPEAFASDPDRLMRFEREARTLASLNHPHIAQVYGIEDSGTTRALVMKLVVGEDLSARIARGPIPLDEALPIARQIAEALDVAPDALGASSSGSIAQGARRPLAHRSGPTMSPGFRPAETARCSRWPTRNGTSGCGSSIAAPSPAPRCRRAMNRARHGCPTGVGSCCRRIPRANRTCFANRWMAQARLNHC